MGLGADLVNRVYAPNDLLTIAPGNALEGFERVKRYGHMLVAVEGWYDSLGKSLNGCDGLTLVTHEDAEKSQRLLAFTAEDAMGWLRPDLEWPEALLLARHNAVGEAAGSVPPEAVIWIGLRRG